MNARIQSIQFLRGFAALLVCCFHMKGLLPEQHIGKTLFGNGSLGVPLFFVISGFIMVHTAKPVQSPMRDAGQFLLRRIVRIVPLYVLVTLVYVAVLHQWAYYAKHPLHALSTLFFVPTFASALGPSYGMPPLEVGWSLNYEMYFYLLLALSMGFKALRWWAMALFILVPVLVFPLLFPGYYIQQLSQGYPWPAYLKVMGQPILLFFLSGMLLGRLHGMLPPSLKPSKAWWLLPLAGLALFFVHYTGHLSPSNHYLVPLLVSVVLVGSFLLAEALCPIQWPAWLIFPGTVSYSLYLVHPLVLHALPKIIRAVGYTGALQGWPYFAVALCVMLVLAWITYRVFEQALSRMLLQRFIKPQTQGA
jgi:hypothetical protein